MHKVKSLKDLGALPGMFTTDAKADHLFRFIRDYQAGNNKATPTIDAMANELEVPREAIYVLMGRLENRGQIFISSRNPLTILIKTPDDEAIVGLAREGAAERFLSVEGERHRVARFIAQHEIEFGTGPSMAMIQKHSNFHTLAYTYRMVEEMAKRGLIESFPPPRLSKKARQLYGIKEPATMNGTTETETKSKRTFIMVNRKSPAERVLPFCRVLAEFKREKGMDAKTPVDSLANMLGYAAQSGGMVSPIVLEAVKRGYIQPRPYKCKSPLQFTEKGLKKFMPELVDDEPTADIQAAIDTPTFDEEHEDAVAALRHPIGEGTGRMTLVADIPTADLVLELIERGYVVKKG